MFLGQLTRRGFTPAPSTTLDHARAAFESAHSLLLNRLVEPTLLAEWQRRIAAAPFVERIAKGEWHGKPPSIDQRVDDRALWGACIFALNDPALFETIESVTGCGSIGSFFGSVYRIVAGAGHFHTWHNDLDGNRMVALSVNLSPRGYRGGVLQIAERDDEHPDALRRGAPETGTGEPRELFAEIANTGWGDAILFEISERLEHRVTEVEGGPDKTAFAGWFVKSPVRARWLRGRAAAHGAR